MLFNTHYSIQHSSFFAQRRLVPITIIIIITIYHYLLYIIIYHFILYILYHMYYTCLYIYNIYMILVYRLISLVGRVFVNGPGGWGSIPGRVIQKTLKMVLDTSLLNTQHYKICIKGKVEQSREMCSVLHLGVIAIEKGAFRSSSIKVNNYILYYIINVILY